MFSFLVNKPPIKKLLARFSNKKLEEIISENNSLKNELKELKETLMIENKEEIDFLWNHYPALIFKFDRDGFLTQINKAIECYNIKQEEVIGKHLSEFLEKKEYNKLEESIQTGNNKSFNIKMGRFLRNQNPPLMSVTLFKSPNETSEPILGIAYDITSKINITGKYEAIYKNAHVGILFLNKDGKFVESNEYATKMFAIPKGKKVSQFKPYELSPLTQPDGQNSEDKAKAMIALAYKNGFQEFDWVHKKYTNENFDAHVVLQSIYGRDEDLAAIVIDISDVKERERRLIQAKEQEAKARKEAEEAKRKKQSFLASVSHEIRTPLNAILGFSELIQGIEENDMEGLKKYNGYVLESGKQLLRIIDDVIDLSKIDAGTFSINKSSFNLREKISNTILNFQQHKQAIEKGLQFVVNYDSNIPDWYNSDPHRIGQVLNNLVENSIKYSNQGTITIGVKAKEINSKKASLELTVSDEGIGIKKEHQEQAFEEFTQLNEDPTKVFGGMGMGLSIVKKITDIFGGSVKFESEEGKGTTFYVNFEADIDVPKKYEPAKQIKEQKNLCVLIAEDDPSNINYISAVMNSKKIDFEIARDGREAVSQIKNNPNKYNLIFMDIGMPEMSGIEATKRIREFSNIPIIALTAYVLSEDRALATQTGMNDFISKPQPLSEFDRVFNKYISGRL